MKKLLVSVIALFGAVSLSAQDVTAIYNEAAAAFGAKNFTEAAAKFEQVIDQGIEAVLGVFGGYDERSCDLRQNSPFAGVLTGVERLEVLERWKAERGQGVAPVVHGAWLPA